MSKKNRYNKIIGYSLIEVLIAITILMIAIVGPLTIAAKSIQSSQYARQQITAYFLAQEGINLVQIIRNDQALAYANDKSVDPWGWVAASSLSSCFTNSGCNIDVSDSSPLTNAISCSNIDDCVIEFDNEGIRSPLYKTSGIDNSTPYKRVITIKNITNDEVLIVSTVKWQTTLLGGEQQVQLESSLLNKYKFIW